MEQAFKDKELKVSIENEDETSFLKFENFENKIELTGSQTDDLTNFYNELFEKIIASKQILTFLFTPEKDNKGLFNEVTAELIQQINDEVKKSKKDFIYIEKFING